VYLLKTRLLIILLHESVRRTINVEYNQLDPLLRSTPGWEHGDVNDSRSGFSPFPGNINQLLFRLDAYADILERTKGVMPEFVNPKYKDERKTVFKKPTRLECMMQDFPTVLQEDETKRVGFTSISAFLCFSPVKNATEEGVKLQEQGTAPGTAASGEADQLAAFRLMMRDVGCHVEDAPEESYLGIKVVPGAAIVLKPSFVSAPAEYKAKFPYPEKVRISARSTLVVDGSGVTIEQLDLDGALVLKCADGKSLTVNKSEPITNAGWVRVKDENSSDEIIKMRGYRLERLETETIEI
jgi:UDP-sugar pyrophosphorylase